MNIRADLGICRDRIDVPRAYKSDLSTSQKDTEEPSFMPGASLKARAF